ncbi:MAG: hypothetical protein IJT73_00030 [Selenomonadaceae bacterium]|nr:hypothetical protein [Selenomonadaceae bacterium]
MKKIIVILAKSSKYGNYCVAGIELATNKWIRPISHDEKIEDAVTAAELTYADNTEAQILDVVEIDFEDTPAQNKIQPENFYFKNSTWKKFGSWNLSDIENFCGFDKTDFIFYDNSRRLELSTITEKNKSLLILPIENISVSTEIRNDELKFYANFSYGGIIYKNFSIGDISIRKKFSDKPCGNFFVAKKAVATFSLTNPYKDNRCYKMFANLFLSD